MKKISLDNSVAEVHSSVIFNSPSTAYVQIVEALRGFWGAGAEVVSAEIFAPRSFAEVVAPLVNSNFPVNWICPIDEASKPLLAGAHFVGVSGCKAEFFSLENGVKAAVYQDSANVYCRCFGVVSAASNADPYAHTMANLLELEKSLSQCGFKYTDVARTWFYNDDILSWYAPFNKARTEFYASRGVFDTLLPASTGIGAPNPAGKLITSSVFAVKSKIGGKPRGKDFLIELPSPLQGGATEYGSSFARAVEVVSPNSRRVMVSGTASIDAAGKTANVGDIQKQAGLTLDVIEGILKSRDMSFADEINAVVYCARAEYVEVFEALNKKLKLAYCPSHSIVCRGDLLFEIELEAAKQK